jgi:CheY-like chemotaxis protein
MTEPASRKALVVDDQPMLGKAIRRMLAGFDVTVLGDAREAFMLIEEGERFDVIISDLMMPFMNGMDLHAAIARIAPDQVARMIFMTGGAFTPQARDFFDQISCPMLEKPFERATLLAAIEDLLTLRGDR